MNWVSTTLEKVFGSIAVIFRGLDMPPLGVLSVGFVEKVTFGEKVELHWGVFGFVDSAVTFTGQIIKNHGMNYMQI